MIKKNIYLAAAVLLGGMGAVSMSGQYAQAAASASYKTNFSQVYYGKNTSYVAKLKNVPSGSTVKFAVVGDAKNYITLSKEKKTGVSGTANVTFRVKKAAIADHMEGKKATIRTRIYNKKGTLVQTLRDKVTIAVDATAVAIKTNKMDVTNMSVGGSYDFDRTLTPATSVNKTYWKVTNSATGADCSSEIGAKGVWVPTKPGTYEVTAITKRKKTATKVRASASLLVVVKESGSTNPNQPSVNPDQPSTDNPSAVSPQAISVVADTNNVITVSLNTEVSTASALAMANYSLDGAGLPAQASVRVSDDRKAIVIDLQNCSFNVTKEYRFGIKNLIAETGEAFADFESSITLTQNIITNNPDTVAPYAANTKVISVTSSVIGVTSGSISNASGSAVTSGDRENVSMASIKTTVSVRLAYTEAVKADEKAIEEYTLNWNGQSLTAKELTFDEGGRSLVTLTFEYDWTAEEAKAESMMNNLSISGAVLKINPLGHLTDLAGNKQRVGEFTL